MSNVITPKEGEEVLMHLHKSIFVFRKQLLIFVLAIAVAILLVTFLYKYPAANVIAGVLLILAIIYAFYYFIIWFYDIYIITNMRVIMHMRKNLFSRDFAEFGHLEVVDVTYSVKGVLATIFQYGSVNVTLGNGQIRELNYLSSPGMIQETLKNLVDVSRRRYS